MITGVRVGRSSRVHGVFLVLCVVLGTAFVLAPRAWGSGLVALASALSAAVLLRELRHRRIRGPLPWWLVLAATLVLTVHNLESLRQVALLGRPTASGLLFETTLPLAYATLFAAALMVVFRYAQRDAGGVIEAVLLGISAASITWVTVLAPAFAEHGAGGGDRLYGLVLVLLISGIAGAVIRAMLVSVRARPALLYFLVAILATLLGNIVGTLTLDPSTGRGTRWLGVVWLVAYLALGAAAAHPTLRHLTAPATPLPTRLTSRRVLMLGMALALNPALAGAAELSGESADAPLLLIGSLLVVVLAMLRVAGLARVHAATEVELARLATRDTLTDLPNRRAIDLHLEAALLRVRATQAAGLVVLFLDLDDFKLVNDAHGHEVGDRLLCTVAARLRGTLRGQDLVGRFGGDEFVVVVEGDPDLVRDDLVRRVEDVLSHPVELDDVQVSARASIGVSVVRPGEAVSASHLLAEADARMYEQKRVSRVARQVMERELS